MAASDFIAEVDLWHFGGMRSKNITKSSSTLQLNIIECEMCNAIDSHVLHGMYFLCVMYFVCVI